jgi:hypothetical protein
MCSAYAFQHIDHARRGTRFKKAVASASAGSVIQETVASTRAETTVSRKTLPERAPGGVEGLTGAGGAYRRNSREPTRFRASIGDDGGMARRLKLKTHNDIPGEVT